MSSSHWLVVWDHPVSGNPTSYEGPELFIVNMYYFSLYPFYLILISIRWRRYVHNMLNHNNTVWSSLICVASCGIRLLNNTMHRFTYLMKYGCLLNMTRHPTPQHCSLFHICYWISTWTQTAYFLLYLFVYNILKLYISRLNDSNVSTSPSPVNRNKLS